MKIVRMLGVAIISVTVVWLLVDAVPPAAVTRTRIRITENRLRDFLHTKGRLPAKLEELPEVLSNRDGEMVDAWGRPLEYSVSGSNVTLKSLGKDGQEGGTGENADIEATITLNN